MSKISISPHHPFPETKFAIELIPPPHTRHKLPESVSEDEAQFLAGIENSSESSSGESEDGVQSNSNTNKPGSKLKDRAVTKQKRKKNIHKLLK